MTIELLEALAADLLEYKHLIGFCIVIENGSLDNGSLYIRSSDLHGLTVGDEKHLVELYVSTLGIGKPLHKDFVASLNFELLACNVYDCVHQTNFLSVWTVSVCASWQLFTCSTAIKTDRKDSDNSMNYKLFFT